MGSMRVAFCVAAAVVVAALPSVVAASMVPSVVPVALGNTIDSDGDGVPDLYDNAPGTFEPSQVDMDADGIGDIIDPTPAGANPHYGDPGLGLFAPTPITAGSHALIQYTLGVATPPGGWGRIELDLNSDNVTDAYYFGPLDTSTVYTIDIAPSVFSAAGWNLNTPGTYVFQAKAIAPGWSSDNYSIETLRVNAAAPEPASLGMLAAGAVSLMWRKRR